MKALVIGIKTHAILVQFEYEGKLDRRYIGRAVYDTTVKNQWIELPEKVLLAGIPYTTVDWDRLGQELNTDISPLEQAMRKAGLWTSEDYRLHPETVKKVLQESPFRGRVDATTVLNLAQS